MINLQTTNARKHLKFDLAPLNLAAHYFWVVPTGRHVQTSYWKIFVFHFDLGVWLSILCVLVLLTVIWYCMESEDLVYSFLLHYQLLFESGNLRIVKILKVSTRILTGTSIFSFLVISTIFKSEMLRSFAVTSYKYPIDSLEDIIKNNFSCYVTDDIKALYESADEFYSRFVAGCNLLDENDNQWSTLYKVGTEESLATVTRILKFRFATNEFFKRGYKKCPVHLVPKQVKFDFVYVYFTKGYPLSERFTEIIRRLHSGGFTTYFRNVVNYKLAKTLKLFEKIRSKTLTLEHISIAFYVFFSGLVISAVVFLLEVFSS
jgi:hypothetical protein